MRKVVVACAALAIGACGSDPSSTSGSTASPVSDDIRQLCVDLINGYRATVGAAPYARWTSAETCADGQAQSDSVTYAQTGKPHGAFGRCGESAQDECPGWGGPPATAIKGCLDMMWKEGPGGGHYDNMSSTSRKRAACGFYILPSGSVWAVQDFQ